MAQEIDLASMPVEDSYDGPRMEGAGRPPAQHSPLHASWGQTYWGLPWHPRDIKHGTCVRPLMAPVRAAAMLAREAWCDCAEGAMSCRREQRGGVHADTRLCRGHAGALQSTEDHPPPICLPDHLAGAAQASGFRLVLSSPVQKRLYSVTALCPSLGAPAGSGACACAGQHKCMASQEVKCMQRAVATEIAANVWRKAGKMIAKRAAQAVLCGHSIACGHTMLCGQVQMRGMSWVARRHGICSKPCARWLMWTSLTTRM